MVGAPLSSVIDRAAHQPSPKAPAALAWHDVELGQIALEALRPDRAAEAQDRDPVGSVAPEQHGRVAAGDQLTETLGQLRGARRWLVELAVEGVEQLADHGAVVRSGDAHLELVHIENHRVLVAVYDRREMFGNAGAVGEAVIEASGLRMSYDGLEAVRGIDLQVRQGEIFTFLGPNGAGKTTTVEILEGHRKRTAGEVRVLGEDPEHADRWWRSRVGVVLQSSRVEPQLTVRECLDLYAGYYPAPRSVQEVIELVGLKKRSEVRCGQLSGGQQRRVDVALALIGDPELVFLDEPTTGFDPSARRSAWEMIDGLRELGKTIFLTTHYMDEAEALADRIVVIKAGAIIAEGSPATLGGRDRAPYQITFSLPDGVACEDLPHALGPARALDHARKVMIESEHVMATMQALSGWSLEHRYEISDLLVRRPALEDVYLELTESPK